jgi:POT family proton-dependent oligopeptide transporter
MVPVFAFLLVNYNLINYIINPIGIIMLVYVVYFGLKEGKVAFGRLMVALVLIFFSMLFWAFYEQGGGSLNLYAARNVNMNFLGLKLSSAAVNNSINGAMVVLMSPVFGWLWVKLSKVNANPNSLVKFGLGLVQLGIGFYMFVLGAKTADNGMVNLFWFAMGYFFMTTGELCLSPIGLSAITKLSPPKMVGLMMGMWFLASAFGQYLAGIIGTLMAIPEESATGAPMNPIESLKIYTGIFNEITMVSIGCGILLLILTPFLKKHMHGVS